MTSILILNTRSKRADLVIYMTAHHNKRHLQLLINDQKTQTLIINQSHQKKMYLLFFPQFVIYVTEKY